MRACKYCKRIFRDDVEVCHLCNRPTDYYTGSEEDVNWLVGIGYKYYEDQSYAQPHLPERFDYPNEKAIVVPVNNRTVDNDFFGDIPEKPVDIYFDRAIPERREEPLPAYDDRKLKKPNAFLNWLRTVDFRIVAIIVVTITVVVLLIVNFDVILAFFAQLIGKIVTAAIVILILWSVIRGFFTRRRFF